METTGPKGDAEAGFVAPLENYESSLAEFAKTRGVDGIEIARVLTLRDQIAEAIDKSSALAVRHEEKINRLDSLLRKLTQSCPHCFDARFGRSRDLIQPSKDRWWWYLESRNPLWVIGALFFFTLSISMITDFSRRLLISDPDVVGILAIAVQALFAVGASSTFTAGGQRWLGSLINRLSVPVRYRDPLKFWAMAFLAALTLAIWQFAPPALAVYYDRRGLAIAEGHPAAALRDYNRALSLNPNDSQTHVNLAGAFLRDFEFTGAIAEYQKALLLDVDNLTAYNNLAYVLLISNNPTTALSVIDDAFNAKPLRPPTNDVKGALYKNLASAEYALGFVWKANEDINRSLKAFPTRSVYCALAKIDTKLGKTADALEAWKTMIATPQRPAQPMLEPDCIRLAEEAIHATH